MICWGRTGGHGQGQAVSRTDQVSKPKEGTLGLKETPFLVLYLLKKSCLRTKPHLVTRFLNHLNEGGRSLLRSAEPCPAPLRSVRGVSLRRGVLSRPWRGTVACQGDQERHRWPGRLSEKMGTNPEHSFGASAGRVCTRPSLPWGWWSRCSFSCDVLATSVPATQT